MTTRTRCHRKFRPRPPAARRGFTFTEFMVAMVVFGIALSGLFPLLAILSRELQPLAETATSPARDWSNPESLVTSHRPNWWYLAANDDLWVRKLGAGAAMGTATVSSSSPSIQSPVVFLDDYEGTLGANDGAGTFTQGTAGNLTSASPLGYKADYHHGKAKAGSIAIWQITVAADGWYSVQATWPNAAATGLDVTSATYTVTARTAPANDMTTVTLSPVNQASPVGGIADVDLVTWWPITPAGNRCVYLRKNDVATVVLYTAEVQASKYLLADAVRIVQNAVTVESVEHRRTARTTIARMPS